MENYLGYFGRQVYRLRKRRGFTQKQLADELGVTQPYIAMLESGRGDREPTLSLVLSIAEMFNVSIDDLFGISAESTMSDPILSLSTADRELIEQLSTRLARIDRKERFESRSNSVVILGDESVQEIESSMGVELSPTIDSSRNRILQATQEELF